MTSNTDPSTDPFGSYFALANAMDAMQQEVGPSAFGGMMMGIDLAAPSAPFASNIPIKKNKHHKYKTHFVYHPDGGYSGQKMSTGCGNIFKTAVEQTFKQTQDWGKVNCKLCLKARKKIENPHIGYKMHFLLPYPIANYFHNSNSLCGMARGNCSWSKAPFTDNWHQVTCGLCIRCAKDFKEAITDFVANKDAEIKRLQDDVKKLKRVQGITDQPPASALTLAGRILDIEG